MMIFIDDLLGARFLSHGRNAAEGFDCYGLVIEVAKRFGHSMPDVKYKRGGMKTLASLYDYWCTDWNQEGCSEKVEETTERKESYIVMFFENKMAVHIGILLDEERFIHADIDGVKISNLDEYYRKDWKVYKWL